MDPSSSLKSEISPSISSIPSNPSISSFPPEPPPVPMKPNYWKVLVIVLLVGLLGLGGFTFYLWQRSNVITSKSETIQVTPTPELQETVTPDTPLQPKIATYKDIRFQYPTDWQIQAKNTAILLQPISANGEFDQMLPKIAVDVIPNPDNLTLAQLNAKAQKTEIPTDIYSTEGKPITISGVTGYYKENQHCEPRTCDLYVILYKKNIYQFSFTFADLTSSVMNQEQQRLIFTQLVNSIILNSIQTPESWSTYQNTGFGFEIKYPKEWTPKLEGTNFTLTNNNYVLTIGFPSAFGPGICIYSDSPDFSKDLSDNPQAEKCGGEFVTIPNPQIEYRRLVKPIPIEGQTASIWQIYSKDPKSTWFVGVPPINFSAPETYDNSVLTVMDKIIETYTSNK